MSPYFLSEFNAGCTLACSLGSEVGGVTKLLGNPGHRPQFHHRCP